MKTYQIILSVLAFVLFPMVAQAQTMDREHLNVNAYVRESHLLNGLWIYDKLIDTKDCVTAGVSVGVNTKP